MLMVIFIVGIIALLMVALLIAYYNLRSTVEIMKNTIDLQNKRYMRCLDGWEKAIQLVKEALSLNDQVIELNKHLYSEPYSDKEDDNNERE